MAMEMSTRLDCPAAIAMGSDWNTAKPVNSAFTT
jgi:hypothetical protein